MSPSQPSHRSPGTLASFRREILILAGALAFGAFAVPPLLWLFGARALGPYAGGGVGALVANFFRGLASASFGFWAVALGPYLIILVIRALIGIVRVAPAAD